MHNGRTISGRRAVELALLWLLPATLTLSGWLWSRLPWMTDELLLLLLATPAVAMTLNVAVGAGLLRLWRFNLAYAVAGVPPQIGLVYAAVINMVTAALAGLLATPGPAAALGFVLLTAVITALLGVLYDLLAVHFGLLDVYVRAHYRNQGTWAIVRSYGFTFFGLVGLLAAISARAGYWLLIEQASGQAALAFVLGLALIVLPCVAVFIALWQRRSRRPRRHASHGDAPA